MKLLGGIASLLGVRFVPENHVAPVFRANMYHRVSGPGYIWIIPLLENLGDPIPTSTRTENFTLEEVLSDDQIPFQVELTVKFSFQPHLATKEAASRLVRARPSALANAVKSYVEEALRSIMVQYSADQIYKRADFSRIARWVGLLLADQGRAKGLIPQANGAVSINVIVPPAEYERAVLAVKQLKIILEALSGHTSTVVNQAITAQLYSGITSGGLDVIALGNNLLPPGHFGSNGQHQIVTQPEQMIPHQTV